MFTHDAPTASRHRLRRTASVVAAGLLVVASGLLTGPAQADTPADWQSSPRVTWLDALLVYLLVPLAVIAVVSFLAFVPALVHQSGYQPGQSWRGESEWFGGPTKGVEAADQVTPEQLEASSAGTGGTSGRW